MANKYVHILEIVYTNGESQIIGLFTKGNIAHGWHKAVAELSALYGVSDDYFRYELSTEEKVNRVNKNNKTEYKWDEVKRYPKIRHYPHELNTFLGHETFNLPPAP